MTPKKTPKEVCAETTGKIICPHCKDLTDPKLENCLMCGMSLKVDEKTQAACEQKEHKAVVNHIDAQRLKYLRLHAVKNMAEAQIKELRSEIEENLKGEFSCGVGCIKWVTSNTKKVNQPGDSEIKFDINKPEFQPQAVKEALSVTLKLNKIGNKLLKDGDPEIQKVASFEPVDKLEVKINPNYTLGQEDILQPTVFDELNKPDDIDNTSDELPDEGEE